MVEFPWTSSSLMILVATTMIFGWFRKASDFGGKPDASTIQGSKALSENGPWKVRLPTNLNPGSPVSQKCGNAMKKCQLNRCLRHQNGASGEAFRTLISLVVFRCFQPVPRLRNSLNLPDQAGMRSWRDWNAQTVFSCSPMVRWPLAIVNDVWK